MLKLPSVKLPSFKLPFGRSQSAIGVEIGSGSILSAQLVGGLSTPLLNGLASASLPRGVVVDGEVVEIEPVADALRAMWKEAGYRHRRVTLGIANHKVLVRQLELPYMGEKELLGAVDYQAQELIPIAREDLILDFQVVGDFVNEEGRRILDLLLVAAPREMIQRFVAAVDSAGLEPWIVYLSSLALVRSLVAPWEAKEMVGEEEESQDVPLVLLNMSGSNSNLVVIERGLPRFARIVPFGENDFTQALAQALSLSFEDAEEMKYRMSLPLNGEAEAEGQAGRAAKVLEEQSYRLVEEVRRSIEYYFGQELKAQSIEKLVLSGGVAQIGNLDKFLADALRVEVQVGRPLQFVRIDEKLAHSPQLTNQEPALAVPIGLALRGLEPA